MRLANGAAEPVIPKDFRTKEKLDFVMRCLESSPLVAGEHWYLVSTAWLRRWQRYCEGLESLPPGEIDNSGIIHPLCGSYGFACLKEGLVMDDDFVALPSSAWRMLVEWNGHPTGSLCISRPVVVNNREPHLEVYLPTVRYRLNSGPLKFMCVPETCTFDEFQKFFLPVGDENSVISLEDDYVPQPEELVCFSLVKYRDQEGEVLNQSQSLISIKELGFLSPTSFVQIDNFPQGPGNEQPIRLGPDGGIFGLYNLGNTCFMNSALQCLSHCEPLTIYFISKTFLQEINATNPIGTRGQIAQVYGALINEMWAGLGGRGKVVDPSRFKSTLGRFEPRFLGFHQQDSQELLSALLDRLHEDLNRIKQKPYIELKEADGRADDVLAMEAWDNHRLRSDSVIVDTFHGQFRSQVSCLACGYVSVTFDPFLFLSLPIPTQTRGSIGITFISGIKADVLRLEVNLRVSTVADILRRLQSEMNVSSTNMIAIEVFQHQVYRVLSMNTSLERILQNRDDIKVYQLEPDMNHSWLSFRLMDPSGYPRFIAYPLLISHKEREDQFEAFGKVVKCLLGLAATTIDTDRIDLHKVVSFHDDRLLGSDSPYRSFIAEFNSQQLKTELGIEIDDFLSPLNLTLQICQVISNGESSVEQVSIDQCLQMFTMKEELTLDESWYCKRCNEHRAASKKMDLWKLPQILIMHLKRFSYSRLWGEKLSTPIKFPVRGLDLSDYLPAKETSLAYDLFAIDHHYGSLGGGHYTAYAKHCVSGKWYEFDDSHVSEVDPGHLASQSVYKSSYLLFYRRRDQGAWDT